MYALMYVQVRFQLAHDRHANHVLHPLYQLPAKSPFNRVSTDPGANPASDALNVTVAFVACNVFRAHVI